MGADPVDDGPMDAQGPTSEQVAAGRRAVVVVASTRAAAGTYPDDAGPILVAGLREAGFETSDAVVVPDGPAIGDALRAAVDARADVVLTSGGTGLSPTDVTPEQTRPLIDTEVPGIAEALRTSGVGVPTSILSRGVAGLSGATLIVNVAGSPGACRDAMRVLEPVLVHAVGQVRGGDHPRSDHPRSHHPGGAHGDGAGAPHEH